MEKQQQEGLPPQSSYQTENMKTNSGVEAGVSVPNHIQSMGVKNGGHLVSNHQNVGDYSNTSFSNQIKQNAPPLESFSQ